MSPRVCTVRRPVAWVRPPASCMARVTNAACSTSRRTRAAGKRAGSHIGAPPHLGREGGAEEGRPPPRVYDGAAVMTRVFSGEANLRWYASP